jgi:hypothetical protein
MPRRTGSCFGALIAGAVGANTDVGASSIGKFKYFQRLTSIRYLVRFLFFIAISAYKSEIKLSTDKKDIKQIEYIVFHIQGFTTDATEARTALQHVSMTVNKVTVRPDYTSIKVG